MIRSTVVLAAFLLAATAGAADRPLIVMSQDHSLVDDCEHFHTQNTTTFPAEAHSQEQKAVTVGSSMKVQASQAGGISIKGWDRTDAQLTVCKFAVGIGHPQVEHLLSGISVATKGGAIIPTGPAINATQMWWVHLILNVPRKTKLTLASDNGGISVRNMYGGILAQTKNGGVSLAQCSGDHHIETTNGGISLDKVNGRTSAKSGGGGISLLGGSGNVTLTSDSGEINIRLGADPWIGGVLDARTQNGDLTLRIRDNYPSRIEAESADAGQIVCRLRACDDFLRIASTQKKLTLGKVSPQAIRLTTGKSPITIEEARP
jgi:hypothetical protein